MGRLLLQVFCFFLISVDVLARKADIIFYGGNIITMEEGGRPCGRGESSCPKVEAVAVTKGAIRAVGSIDKVFRHAGRKTQVIFLNQQTLMPGFIEPHTHAIISANVRSQIPIGATMYSSYDGIRTAMVSKLEELAADPHNENWGIFFGWDPELVDDLPALSADFLDENFSDSIPIIVVGQSGHVAWVNHPALKAANLTDTSESPPGWHVIRDSNDNPTGKLLEAPAILGMIGKAPRPDGQTFVEDLRAQWRAYASAGFTTVTELVYQPNPILDQVLMYSADALDFPLRLALYRLIRAVKDNDRPAGQNPTGGVGNYSSRLWEAGIKLIADGSPHSGTSAVREPYMYTPLTETLGFPEAPGYGILNMETEALFDTVKRHHQEGTQLAIHAHGERAVDQVLKVYQQVMSRFPNEDNRHRMEHLGLMTVEQIARAGKLNLALSFFVDHLRFYAQSYKTNIFSDRVNRWTPLSEATKNGITWTIHQDHPTFPGEPSPFANMKTAVTRCTRDDPNTPYGPEYRVSIHEALKAYTINAAWQLHQDQKVGSIKVGKRADLVVLSENPYDVDPFELERIRVIETFVDGRRNNLTTLECIEGANNLAVLRQADE